MSGQGYELNVCHRFIIIIEFQNNPGQGTLKLTCQTGLTYLPDQPLWPQCVSYLPCTEPPLDQQVMNYDWTPSKGTLPNMTVLYAIF